MNELEYARRAYIAYGNNVDWLNYQGLDMPPWHELTEPIKLAWVAAASAVVDYYICIND